jgi:hypothetical protein
MPEDGRKKALRVGAGGVNSSVWQIPVALISTITSPAFGPSSRTVSIDRGSPALCATAARTSITSLPLAQSGRQPRKPMPG